ATRANSSRRTIIPAREADKNTAPIGTIVSNSNRGTCSSRRRDGKNSNASPSGTTNSTNPAKWSKSTKGPNGLAAGGTAIVQYNLPLNVKCWIIPNNDTANPKLSRNQTNCLICSFV